VVSQGHDIFLAKFPNKNIKLLVGVMVSARDTSSVNGQFEPMLCQIKNYKTVIGCFSPMQAAFMIKSRVVERESG
jgi:hypothetical protein